jgi:hypothetical protein
MFGDYAESDFFLRILVKRVRKIFLEHKAQEGQNCHRCNHAVLLGIEISVAPLTVWWMLFK